MRLPKRRRSRQVPSTVDARWCLWGPVARVLVERAVVLCCLAVQAESRGLIGELIDYTRARVGAGLETQICCRVSTGATIHARARRTRRCTCRLSSWLSGRLSSWLHSRSIACVAHRASWVRSTLTEATRARQISSTVCARRAHLSRTRITSEQCAVFLARLAVDSPVHRLLSDWIQCACARVCVTFEGQIGGSVVAGATVLAWQRCTHASADRW